MKVQFGPTESRCTGRTESGTVKELREQCSVASEQGSEKGRDFRPESLVGPADWGLDGQELNA